MSNIRNAIDYLSSVDTLGSNAAYEELDGLLKAMRFMLYIFDRELPEGTIGRQACDEAIAAMKGQME